MSLDLQTELVCAAALGPVHLHAAMFQKLAALKLDGDDVFAIVQMLEAERAKDEACQHKQAAAGEPVKQAVDPGLVRSIAMGSMLSVPAMAMINKIRGQQQKDEGWAGLVSHAPELHQQDPERLRAVYDLLHSTAPSVAQNPLVAADLAKQMMAMPLMDVGTVGRLATTGKDIASARGDGPKDMWTQGGEALKGLPDRVRGIQMLTTGKMAEFAVPVSYTDPRGVKCAFNWATPAMKAAGLTDLVSGSDQGAVGSGNNMEQAGNAFEMNQNTMGSNMLPLDAVVRELLMKEQELSQREEALMQQEMAMQQAQATMGQMGPAYQQQTGVDPSTGQPAQEQSQEPAAPEQDPAAAPAQDPGQDPNAAPEGAAPSPAGSEASPDNAEQAPADDGQAPPADDPNAAQGMVPPQNPGQQPAPGTEDSGALPPADEQAAASQEPAPGQEQAANEEAVPASEPTAEQMPAVDQDQAVTAPADGVVDPETGAPAATGADESLPGGEPKDSTDKEKTEDEGPTTGTPLGDGAPVADASQLPPSDGTPPADLTGGEAPASPDAGALPPEMSATPADAGMPPEAAPTGMPPASPDMSMLPAAAPSAAPGQGGIVLSVPLPTLQITIKTSEFQLDPAVGEQVDEFLASLRM